MFAVGYHNGGLSLKDRNLVESLFLSGDVKILCTTNTLAHGINLPAHTVVIKSTQHLYVDLSFLPPVNRNLKNLCNLPKMYFVPATKRKASTWNTIGPRYYRFVNSLDTHQLKR